VQPNFLVHVSRVARMQNDFTLHIQAQLRPIHCDLSYTLIQVCTEARTRALVLVLVLVLHFYC
jgi:hypothetical protein